MCFVNSTDCKSVASAADAAAAVCQYALFRKIPAIPVGAGFAGWSGWWSSWTRFLRGEGVVVAGLEPEADAAVDSIQSQESPVLAENTVQHSSLLRRRRRRRARPAFRSAIPTVSPQRSLPRAAVRKGPLWRPIAAPSRATRLSICPDTLFLIF